METKQKSERIRMGVIAASSFVAQAAVIPAICKSGKAEIAGIASMSAGQRLRDAKVFPSYNDLMSSKDIDAVYVPLPNSLHAEAVRSALSNGKHVLCEKPLAMSEAEAVELACIAEMNGLVLMEAYMTHYHPRTQKILELVGESESSRLRHMHARFTSTLSKSDDHRWRPEMGGGSIRDVGIYLIAPALAAFGSTPISVFGEASWTASGVDESFSGLLAFENGGSATIFSSFRAGEEQRLEFILENGRISVDRAFTPTADDNDFEVSDQQGGVRKVTTRSADSYLEMIDHFCDLIDGRASPSRPVSESALVQKVIDNLIVSAAKGEVRYLG